MTRIERSYSIKKKREALALTSQVGIKTASQRLNIPRGTLFDWTKQAEAIYGFQGNAMSRFLKGQGRKEIFPAVSDVLTNGFSSQKPQAAKNSYQGLEETRAEFPLSFSSKYEAFRGGGVLNVDDTGILFDMPPIKSWAGRG
ncbi:unnamed protein product [Phytophthora fragariaefolia]|uniref:Unnamed protein product n=1 Tax=Phytophthora fragariaefolia TaxID=1490495 RepID=A0A9W6YFR8_9STRA|nr:unnamed protein product [Phytophthora fragariaefolia]